MARFSHSNRVPVDKVLDRWRDECLIADGSLLLPGQELWTQENFAGLFQQFNEDGRVGPESFEEKLESQLSDASEAEIRLMADVIATHYLFVSSVGGDRKRELTGQVLGWSGDEFPEDSDVSAAFDGGIGSGGQGFNNTRPALLAYIIAFGSRWKAENEEMRRLLLDDAWDFRDWLVGDDDQADGGEQMMRHLLLHLVFPDEYERISSGDDKYLIVNALGGLVENLKDDLDIDRKLWAVREAIREVMPNGQPRINGAIDFYEKPLRETWDPEDTGDPPGERGLSNVDALLHKKQVVLYGPPGTGKTYEAKALAERLIRREALGRWGPVRYLQSETELQALVGHQVRRLQLHQAYSYEDFIRGLRLTPDGTEPRDGTLLELAKEMRTVEAASSDSPALPWVLILDEVNRTDLSRLLGEVFSLLDDRDAPINLALPDTDGNTEFRLPEDLFLIGTMNLIDQSVEQLDFALRRRFLWLPAGFRADLIPVIVEQRWKAIDHEKFPWMRRHGWNDARDDIERLAERAEDLNQLIRDSNFLGEQYEVGHTYFLDVVGMVVRSPKVQTSRSWRGHYLWSRSGQPLAPLEDLWTHSLDPLLAEYLAGVGPGDQEQELRTLKQMFLAPAS